MRKQIEDLETSLDSLRQQNLQDEIDREAERLQWVSDNADWYELAGSEDGSELLRPNTLADRVTQAQSKVGSESTATTNAHLNEYSGEDCDAKIEAFIGLLFPVSEIGK